MDRRFRDHIVVVVALAVVAAVGTNQARSAGGGKMNVERKPFGKTKDGKQVDLYTLTNANGLQARIMTYGATLIGLDAPDKNGKFDNVTLYLDSLDDYLAGHPSMGPVVGRYANRIGLAKFSIDGKVYKLAANNGPNHLHGGPKGYQALVWDARPVQRDNSVGVELSLVSPDGDEGYPGRLEVKMTYRLTTDNELRMEYEAKTDKTTHVNLTNHAYWNLAGAGSGDVLGHRLMIRADQYLPTDEGKIPLGPPKGVRGTVMDFTKPMTIGSRIEKVEAGGYDHCYVLNKENPGELTLAARVVDPKSGRTMEVRTTEPGVQIYTANGLTDRYSGGGKPYGRYHGVCLECQHFPDSPNKPQYPSTLLHPGETYKQTTVHKFGVEE